MNERRQMGALEAEILELLQSAVPEALTPGHVLERLGGTLAYSTVVTVLTRMHDKELLSRVKQGRAFAYSPIADRHGMTARRMRAALDADPDRRAVLARFVDDLSLGDEEILRGLLRDTLPTQLPAQQD